MVRLYLPLFGQEEESNIFFLLRENSVEVGVKGSCCQMDEGNVQRLSGQGRAVDVYWLVGFGQSPCLRDRLVDSSPVLALPMGHLVVEETRERLIRFSA